MVSDRDLALALQQVQWLEQLLLPHLKTEDLAERDRVQHAARMTKPLRQSLETWLSLRAMRAQLSSVTR